MDIRVTISQTNQDDLVFTELHLPVVDGITYPLIKPGGYSWSTGSTSEEGIALQPTASIELTDTNNILSTIFLDETRFLRGKAVVVNFGDQRHLWELDTYHSNGKSASLGLVSPVASALVQNVPSDPFRLVLRENVAAPNYNQADYYANLDPAQAVPAQETAEQIQARLALSFTFDGYVDGTVQPPPGSLYFRVDDEIVSINSTQLGTLVGSESSSSINLETVSRGNYGTEATEHLAGASVVQVPVIEAPPGTALRRVLELAGKTIVPDPATVNTVTNPILEVASEAILNGGTQGEAEPMTITFYEETTLGDVIEQIAVMTGAFIYWSVEDRVIKVYRPGVQSIFDVRNLDASDIVDRPLPALTLGSRQYTRAQMRAQKRNLNEDEHTQIATFVDGDAEHPDEYNRQLLFEKEIMLYDFPFPHRDNIANAQDRTDYTRRSDRVLGELRAAVRRIVVRYRNPRQELRFDSSHGNLSLSTFVRLTHPSVPDPSRLFQIVGVSRDASKFHSSYKCVSVRSDSGVLPFGTHNSSVDIVFNTSSTVNMNLFTEIRERYSVFDPAALTGDLTVRINPAGERTIIGSTILGRGAIHIDGFDNVQSITIIAGNATTVVGRAGSASLLDDDRDTRKNGGDCISITGGKGGIITLGNQVNFRPGGGASGFGESRLGLPDSLPGYGWLDGTGLQQGGVVSGNNRILFSSNNGYAILGNGGTQAAAGEPIAFSAAIFNNALVTATTDRLNVNLGNQGDGLDARYNFYAPGTGGVLIKEVEG